MREILKAMYLYYPVARALALSPDRGWAASQLSQGVGWSAARVTSALRRLVRLGLATRGAVGLAEEGDAHFLYRADARLLLWWRHVGEMEARDGQAAE